MATKTPTKKIGIIGSGLIGQSWAMLFASSGYEIKLFDSQQGQAEKALSNIGEQLHFLEKEGLLRGELSRQEQRARLSSCPSLEDCVKDSFYIQECVPERLETKSKVWSEVDKLADSTTIFASSTSSLLPSSISQHLEHKNRFLVVHPTNPPYYAPLVELIPAPWTDDDVVPTTKSLMLQVGQDPVILKKEIDGFVLNRIQYSILGEAWRLIMDDVISAEDLDKVMSSGLGVRYAFMGPLETAYLNADGIQSYCERYSDMIYEIQNSFGPPIRMEGETGAKIQKELDKYSCPVSEIPLRRQWRDKRLVALAKLKKELDNRQST